MEYRVQKLIGLGLKKTVFSHYSNIPIFHHSLNNYSNISIFPENHAD